MKIELKCNNLERQPPQLGNFQIAGNEPFRRKRLNGNHPLPRILHCELEIPLCIEHKLATSYWWIEMPKKYLFIEK